MEQWFVAPVGKTGLLLGKLIPCALVGFLETLIVLTVTVCCLVIFALSLTRFQKQLGGQ